MVDSHINYGVWSIRELFQNTSLRIPGYQRPYRWTKKNVSRLLDDFEKFRSLPQYRVGTIVLHENDKGELNIVDGQQRIVTFLLILWAESGKEDIPNSLKEELESLVSPHMDALEFSENTSQSHISENFRYVRHRLTRDERLIARDILERCEIVWFKLENISEAFQFFDSQNARGKDLYPHDLLKAYHLREFSKEREDRTEESVARWQGIDSEDLEKLFGTYLYSIKQWSRGRSARQFTKDDVDIFKGVNLKNGETYPFMKTYQIADTWLESKESDEQERILGGGFPHQLDQPILNGYRFFQFVSHYNSKLDDIDSNNLKQKLNSRGVKIIDTIDNYEGHNRTGDRYIRMMFDCALLSVIDRFGYPEKELFSRLVEYIFVWSYKLRLKRIAVYLASVDKHVLEGLNIFRRIWEVTNPSDIFKFTPEGLVGEERSSKTTAIYNLFSEWGYVNENE